MNTAVLIAVGDELLSGIRREGNCASLAWRLHDAGWRSVRIEVIPDELPDIADALSRWVGKVDLLVLSGGLGPTHDDKTRAALAEYLGCDLVIDDELYDRVLSRYEATTRERLERSRPLQGAIPRAAKGVYNPAGSALGIYFEKEGTKVWSFPGVPFEFEAMTARELLPLLPPAHGWESVGIIGVPESLVVGRVAEIIADSRLHISILPSFGLVEFVIRGEAERVGAAARTVRERFAADALPRGCVTLPQAILRTGTEKGLTVSCAESCTGGLVGASMTELPGSSAVFMGSAVVYDNEAKKRVLGVPPSVTERYGAVSAECAGEMARGALGLYGTSVAVAVTGIAGPDGGSAEKPVGTIWFALASRTDGGTECQSFLRRLDGGRELVRERAVRVALSAIWRRMCDL
ncbi:MAG: nicotinamide-nucleotide amidohydrolase family protein [Synergistaceae bacterium]|nr:nicotinamide-nucleotide amidohydrolase family protein [Synergistaceae bacterium]